VICAACAGASAAGVGFIVRFVLAIGVSYIISHLRVIGGGDLKMFSVIIGLTGVRHFMVILLLGSILCAIIRGVLILGKRKTVKDTFPMAPYVLMGFVCWRCICVAS
jgi:Flp pilus assembly protein protease CpaA